MTNLLVSIATSSSSRSNQSSGTSSDSTTVSDITLKFPESDFLTRELFSRESTKFATGRSSSGPTCLLKTPFFFLDFLTITTCRNWAQRPTLVYLPLVTKLIRKNLFTCSFSKVLDLEL